MVSVVEAAALLALVSLRSTLDYSDRTTAESVVRVLGFVRTLRVVRISNHWTAARRLGAASGRALARVWPFLALLLVLLVSFALLGLQLWGVTYPLTPPGADGKTSGSNGGVLGAGDGGGASAEEGALLFSNAWYSFISTFQVLTGENWNSILYTFMGDGSNLGQEAVAVVFFVTLQFCGFILVLPFFLAAFISELGMGAEAWRRREKDRQRQRRRRQRRLRRQRERERKRGERRKKGLSFAGWGKRERELEVTRAEHRHKEERKEVLAAAILGGAEVGAAALSSRSGGSSQRSSDRRSQSSASSIDRIEDEDVTSSNRSSLADIAEEQALAGEAAAAAAAAAAVTTPTTAATTTHILKLRLRLRSSRFFSDGGALDLLALVAIAASCALLLVDPTTVPPQAVRACEIANLALVCFFTVEAAAKVFAFGLWNAPGRAVRDDAQVPPPYFRCGWNVLDLCLLLSGWTEAAILLYVGLSDAGDPSQAQSTLARKLRGFVALRALRPLRALRRFGQMRVVIGTIGRTAPRLLSLFAVAFVAYLLMALVGVELYMGALQQCNDPSITSPADCVGVFYATAAKPWTCYLLATTADTAECLRTPPPPLDASAVLTPLSATSPALPELPLGYPTPTEFAVQVSLRFRGRKKYGRQSNPQLNHRDNTVPTPLPSLRSESGATSSVTHLTTLPPLCSPSLACRQRRCGTRSCCLASPPSGQGVPCAQETRRAAPCFSSWS